MSATASHLPASTIGEGVFSVTVAKEIDAPIDTVWAVLTDFKSYGDWNPFVRSMAIASPSKQPAEDQAPAVGKYLLMTCHFPPSMDNPKKVEKSYECITHWDESTHSLCWQNKDFPSMLFITERRQVLTPISEEKTLYETRVTFAKALAYAAKLMVKGDVQKGFEEMGEGLKRTAEEKHNIKRSS